MDNKQIRVVMRDNNIYMWKELSEERKQQVMSAIEEIKLDRLKEQK